MPSQESPPSIASLSGFRARILECAGRYGISRVRVFGSLPRGEAGPDSDVDLLVEVDDLKVIGLGPLAGFRYEISELLGCRVDVVTLELLREDARAAALAEAVDL